MFEALQAANPAHRYDVAWVELSPIEFSTTINKWLSGLEGSRFFSGPARSRRKALAEEFNQVLYLYKALLTRYHEKGSMSRDVRIVDQRINYYRTKYETVFKTPLAPANTELPLELATLTDKLTAVAAKRDVLDLKKKAIRYWLKGLRDFNEHIEFDEDDDLMLYLQYMGSVAPTKLRAYLGVLTKDAYKVMGMTEPRKWISSSLEVQTGGSAEAGVTWTKDRFKKAVKAEAQASYGIKLSGEFAIEFEGLSAKLSADAFLGASAEASAELMHTYGQGIHGEASVDAMIGVKITAKAELDAADIFLAELSAEAFAGALANAKVEFTATVGHLSFGIEAEAFAGARITGTAAMTFRVAGYDIIKGEAKGSLSAGIGAAFKLEFEASAFGGTKLGVEASATMGVGAGAGTEFTVYSENIGRAAHSLYFMAYLRFASDELTRHAWREYFRDLEDNELLLQKADKIMDELLGQCYMEYQSTFNTLGKYDQLKGLALWKTTGSPRLTSTT